MIRHLYFAALLALAPLAHGQKSPNIVTSGKYQIELRIPDEGIFSGEQIDVEFRLSDTTQNDPIEGKKGIPNATPTASVVMPAMPGMPIMRPRIHSEGVPGDYGIELFFPHGGDYRIEVATKQMKAAFLVTVKDDRKGVKVVKPYKIELIDFPAHLRSGQAVNLKLAIKDSKAGVRVRQFDISHTKALHLMLVSKDLSWFVHEHPTAHPDGTFTLTQTFPMGGDYLIFADTAPKDKGSQIVSTPVHIEGSPGIWRPKLIPTLGPVSANGFSAKLRFLDNPIPVGKSTLLSFALKDDKTGKPVTDLEPYLGAHGHLMIIHQDGQVFVHSHPAEGPEAEKRLRKGEIQFMARFPKAGIYKAWVQFQRHGKVATLPFVFVVKG